MKDKPLILVVDDQPQNIELLEAYLVPQGYEIVRAASGEEALEKLSGHPIDLVLLDVMMPGMDGFEVTRRVRQDETNRLLPVILVTALRETEDRVKGIEAGCDDFISKPVDKMEVLARVRSLLKVKAYNDLMSNYRKELESEVAKRTEELTRMHQRLLRQQQMERDLQLARQVQRSFLPEKLPEAPGMEFCATYRAALEVGGDFYDFIETGKGKLGVVVGDVAGKGIPAALMMARTTSDVRSLAMNDTPPATVVRRLNDHFNATGAEGTFITLIYALLDITDHSFSMVNAAHPPPLLRDAQGKVTGLRVCTNFPVGAVKDNEFEEERHALKPGEVVCLLTDGVTEAMNAREELFGTARVLASVARPANSPREVMENLLQDVQAFVGETHQSDDLTLVCFGVRG